MGEQTQFEPGDRVPNDGMYTEVSEAQHTGSVKDPRVTRFTRGQHFPETSNKDRKWTHKKN